MKVFGSSITGTQISNANSVQTHVTSLAVDGSRNSHYSLQSVRSVSAVRVLARRPPPSHHATAKAQAQELEIYAVSLIMLSFAMISELRAHCYALNALILLHDMLLS
jgi:hypothetical protein